MTQQVVLTDSQIHDLWNVVDPEDIRDYSGRSMYGQTCLGIVIYGPCDMWRICSDLDEELRSILGEPKLDELGLNNVIYWPHVALDWASIEP